MTKTGPQKYPGAVTDLFFGNGRYSGSDMEVNVSVLHTTEGTSLVSYSSGAEAPTGTLVPDFARKRLVMHQHFDIDESARALENPAGGVETNTLNVCQWELVGTCDPATKVRWERAGLQQDVDFIYWPAPPEWALAGVADLHAWLTRNHGVPLTSTVDWLAYPASYGNSKVRMSNSQWNSYRGICGHQHVPENVHGDPGNFPIQRMLDLAKAKLTGINAPSAPAKARDEVSLSRLIKAARTDPGARQGHQTYPKGVKVVERALYAEGLLPKSYAYDGSFGTTTTTAYSHLQREYGYRGADADGIPGRSSLTRLGRAHAFSVTA